MLKFATVEITGAHMPAMPGFREQRIGTLRTAARHDFQYTPREGMIYVRSRAISSRCNENFDEFPAAEIKKAYKTFIGKPVFVNHHNADKRRARGFVIDAHLHEDRNPDGSPDTWAEVLMEVDALNYPKLARAVLKREINRTSMGVDCEQSQCTACGNIARTAADYCSHVPRQKGQYIYRVTASGRKRGEVIREICSGLHFFENSLLVEAPADPTAVVIEVRDHSMPRMAKAASRQRPFLDPAQFFARTASARPMGTPNKSKSKGNHPNVDTSTCSECGGPIYYMPTSKRWMHDDDAGAGVPHDGRPSQS